MECLWIPSVHPIAVIALNEDRYDFLNGVYFVESTQISLSNFEGDFKITGRAINASYRHTSLDPNDSGFNLDQIVPFVPQLRSLGIRLPEALQRSAITATFNPFTDA